MTPSPTSKTKPFCSTGSFVHDEIKTDLPVAEIKEIVMSGKVVVLKDVFKSERDNLLALRTAVFEWGQTTEPLVEPDPKSNCHCLQSGVSKFQKTPHVYHSYNFNHISDMAPALADQLYKYFKPLSHFSNSITGNSARLEGFEEGPTFHPQIIQYPLGGGIFGRHVHLLEPQRIGLIVGLSRYGTDYDSGGTCFEADGSVIDIESDHDLGDIALFRYDLPHWVTPSDLRCKFDWNSDRGRWTMVLPYY